MAISGRIWPQAASASAGPPPVSTFPAVRAGDAVAGRVHRQGGDPRRPVRPAVRRLDGLSRAEGRPDGQRVDPDCRARDLGRSNGSGGSTILENNIVQTIGSAGESLAAGVVFTIPALIFLVPNGPAYFNYWQLTLLAIAGGILGVLMMVPLRQRADREGAWRASVPGRHRVRRRAGRRRARRRTRADGVHGPRRRGALEVAVVDLPDLPDRRSATPCRGRACSRTRRSTSICRPNTWGSVTSSGRESPGVMFAGGVLSWLVLLPLLVDPRQLHDGPVSPSSRERSADRPDVGAASCGARTSATRERAPCWRRA